MSAEPTVTDSSQRAESLYRLAVCHLPGPLPITRARVLRAALLWMGGIFVTFLLIRFDTAIVAYLREFPTMQSSPIWTGLRWLAETIALVLLTLALLLHRHRKVIVSHLLLAALLGFCLTHFGKTLIVRERPLRYATLSGVNWSTSWHGVSPELNRRSSFASFPSGHSIAVFAVAGTIAWFFPRVRTWCYLLAAGCAASRVMQNAHWPSDCWAGSLLGWLSAWMSLRMRGLTSLLPRASKNSNF